MKPIHRTTAMLGALLALGLLAWAAGRAAVPGPSGGQGEAVAAALGVHPGAKVEAGTELRVKLSQTLSSKTGYAGMAWTGVVAEDVRDGERLVIPQGCEVRGFVVVARAAQRGARAMLDLAIRSVTMDGKTTSLDARAEPVVAGSTRARNVGAIASGIAAGALLGSAIGKDGKDAAIGGLLGGAAATRAVASSQGYQVVLKEGTTLGFVVHRRVAMR